MEGKDLGVRESQDRETLLNIIRQKNKILMAVSILFIYLTDQKPKNANNGSKYNNDYTENHLSFKYKDEKMIAISNCLREISTTPMSFKMCY